MANVEEGARLPEGLPEGAVAVSAEIEAETAGMDEREARALLAEFGVGGGITYDSTPRGEYEEVTAKARVLSERQPDLDPTAPQTSFLSTAVVTTPSRSWSVEPSSFRTLLTKRGPALRSPITRSAKSIRVR